MTKGTMLGVRLTSEQMEQLQARAQAEGCKSLSKWARAKLLADSESAPCPRCAMTDAVLDGTINSIAHRQITCQTCGYTRLVDILPYPVDPGCPNCAMKETEAGYPAGRKDYVLCNPITKEPTDQPVPDGIVAIPFGQHQNVTPRPKHWNEAHVVTVASDPEPRRWAQEWAAMESMDPGEAMARFTELRAGRKLPKGFGQWSKAERIAWLDREMPL